MHQHRNGLMLFFIPATISVQIMKYYGYRWFLEGTTLLLGNILKAGSIQSSLESFQRGLKMKRSSENLKRKRKVCVLCACGFWSEPDGPQLSTRSQKAGCKPFHRYQDQIAGGRQILATKKYLLAHWLFRDWVANNMHFSVCKSQCAINKFSCHFSEVHRSITETFFISSKIDLMQ